MNKKLNRSGSLSLRSALAVGGVVLMALGLSQVVDTQAAFTDTANANVSTLASGNFFPTPLTPSVTCTTNPDNDWNLGSNRANLSWPAVAGATGYYVELVYGDGSYYRHYDVTAPTTSVTGISTTSPRASVYARVYTKNGPATSSGYTSSRQISYKDLVTSRTECQGTNAANKPNQPWEDVSTWTPGSPSPNQASFASRKGPTGMAPDEVTTSPVPTESPSETTSTVEAPTPATKTPSVSAPKTTTEAPPTTTPQTPTVTTTTTQPTTTTTTPPASAAHREVDLGAGLTAKLADDNVVVLSDGVEKCSVTVDDAETIVDNGDGTLAVADRDGATHYVDAATCMIS